MDGGIASGGTTSFRGEVRDLRPSLGAQITLLLFGNGVANSGDTRARATSS